MTVRHHRANMLRIRFDMRYKTRLVKLDTKQRMPQRKLSKKVEKLTGAIRKRSVLQTKPRTESSRLLILSNKQSAGLFG